MLFCTLRNDCYWIFFFFSVTMTVYYLLVEFLCMDEATCTLDDPILTHIDISGSAQFESAIQVRYSQPHMV